MTCYNRTMKYILDFDEVLFNTTALKEKMEALNLSQGERGLDVFETIQEQDPEFDFVSLVFSGALEFIQKYGDTCIIVSSASSEKAENNTDLEKQIAFQMEKITRSGVTSYVSDVRVVGKEKSEALAELKVEFGDELIFVDDRQGYVKEARELGIESVWMDREGKGHMTNTEGVPTMLEFPRVGSFKEFAKYANSWEKKN